MKRNKAEKRFSNNCNSSPMWMHQRLLVPTWHHSWPFLLLYYDGECDARFLCHDLYQSQPCKLMQIFAEIMMNTFLGGTIYTFFSSSETKIPFLNNTNLITLWSIELKRLIIGYDKYDSIQIVLICPVKCLKTCTNMFNNK